MIALRQIMKKLSMLLVSFLYLNLSLLFANGFSETSSSFNSTDEEVSMSVSRSSGEVKLSILVKDLSQYDHILIERSADNPNYFGKCKYISCADAKTENGKIVQSDKYPYSATKDVFYRIKTVTKDGIERAYPAVLLAAITQ